MIRILHLIETGGPGGAEMVLFNLATGIDRVKCQSVVGLLRKGWLYNQLVSGGIDVRILPSGGSFDIRILLSLLRLIKEKRINLVHSHLMDMNFYSSIAAKMAKIPHIATEHGDIHHLSKTGRLITIKARAVAHLSNKIICVSRFTKEAFIRRAQVNENKVLVIYNGIPVSNFCNVINRVKKKTELGIKEGDILIGSTGNLYSIKGHVYLLKATKEVLQRFKNVKLLILGRGELLEKLKRECSELGISGNVFFLGYRNDVFEILKIIDIFVLSSISESFSIAIVEAMLAGKPVIATRSGGPEEIVIDGETGFLVTPRNSEEIAEKIIYLIENEGIGKSMGDKGRARAEKYFNLKTMIANYEHVYEKYAKHFS